MSFFNKIVESICKTPKVGGYIGYMGLSDWWFETFPEKQRKYMENKFNPLDGSGETLTKGKIINIQRSHSGLLCDLSGWFNTKKDIRLAIKIINKAEELLPQNDRIDIKHFLFQNKIEIYYKDRDNVKSFDMAITACEQQIAISEQAAKYFKGKGSIPSHKGYEQLCIIRHKQNRPYDVVDLSIKANSQGWHGDWESRMRRSRIMLEKHIAKQKAGAKSTVKTNKNSPK